MNPLGSIELSKVFARGQTVIPKDLRTWLAIREGDLLSWKATKEGLLVRRAEISHGSKDKSELRFGDSDWAKLDSLVADQRAKNEFTIYEELKSAHEHSRRLRRASRKK